MKRKVFTFAAVVISMVMMLCGCSKKTEEIKIDERVILSNGAYKSITDGVCSIYSMNDNGIYEKEDTEEVISAYNSRSGNYIFTVGEKLFVNYYGENIEINDTNIQTPKLSGDGEYLFYFKNDKYLEPKIYDLKQKTQETIENKAVISGKFADWISDSMIVYYGVRSEDKKSGVFVYDINNKSEELIYEIEKGYISYLKTIDDEVVFIEDNMENKKILISLKNDEIKELSNNLVDLKDIIKIDDKIYVLGKAKDNVYTIYEVLNEGLHRIVYDFPIMINLEKGLSLSDKGELLFMGSNDDYDEQNIYSYYDGSVSLASKAEGDYTFINMN